MTDVWVGRKDNFAVRNYYERERATSNQNQVEITNDPHQPQFVNEDFLVMKYWRDIPNALYKGNDYLKENTTLYLPKNLGESNELYELRLRRSVLYNVYGNFIDKISLIPFRHGVTWGLDVPTKIQDYCKNIDMTGTNLENWAINFYKDANINGISFYLVENPQLSPNRTLYDDIQEGDLNRPYFVHIPANNLYGWNYEFNNGNMELTQIRFVRYVDIQEGAFGVKKYKEYVVYSKDVIQVYRSKLTASSAEVVELVNVVPNRLGFIPIVTLNLNQLGFMISKPLYLNLAELNLRHYQSYSDQININHYARVPIMFAKGMNTGSEHETIPITAGMIIGGPDSGDLKFVEHSGASINAGMNEIKDIEEKMSIISGEYYNQKNSSQITATSAILNKIESGVVPGANIRILESAINQGFELMRLYDRSIPAFTTGVNLNTEDSIVPETANFQYVTNMYAQGIIDRDTYLKESKRRNILDDDSELNTSGELPGGLNNRPIDVNQ